MPRGTQLIVIPRNILESIVAEADLLSPRETGGVLLGFRKDPDNIVITDMIGPGPNAKHHRFTFEPDYEFQEKEIAKMYMLRGSIEYLGDWHSHPLGSIMPSEKDKSVLRKIASHDPARCRRPVMCIMAGGRPDWTPSAWEFDGTSYQKTAMKIVHQKC